MEERDILGRVLCRDLPGVVARVGGWRWVRCDVPDGRGVSASRRILDSDVDLVARHHVAMASSHAYGRRDQEPAAVVPVGSVSHIHDGIRRRAVDIVASEEDGS